MSDIQIFHMVDGKTIVGKVTYQGDDKVCIEKPCEIIIVPPRTAHNKSDIPQLFFAPYLTIIGALEPFDLIEVKPMHILQTRGDAPKDIADGYLEITSGIQLATTI